MTQIHEMGNAEAVATSEGIRDELGYALQSLDRAEHQANELGRKLRGNVPEEAKTGLSDEQPLQSAVHEVWNRMERLANNLADLNSLL